MLRTSIRNTVMLTLGVALFLGACRPSISPTIEGTDLGEPTRESAVPTLVSEKETGTESVKDIATPNDLQAEGMIPTPRLELVATDPTTVTLAAGKPTLLEFFAFW